MNRPDRKTHPLRRALISALALIPLGVALHYVYDWTGQHAVAGIFAALNESTWEHLKLAFWPMLLVAPFHWWLYDRPVGWLPATAVRVVTAPLLIIVLFYGYTAILATHHLPLDLAVFALSVIGGEILGHRIMERTFDGWVHVLAGVVIVLMIAAMVAFSFAPPDWFLFEPPA
ncbi:MAG: DUF6512 family protein [Longimicrobiales bacterium]